MERRCILWFVNLCAEYGVRLGRIALSFNLNVDNVFDAATTTGYFPYRTRYTLAVSEDMILSKNWELETTPGYVPGSAFMKPVWFFPPISARLGVRYSF